MIIGISGISGSGKTTVGKILATDIDGKFIDQDLFFKKRKPLIKVSNGETKLNYDCDEAIDIKAMNDAIRSASKEKKYVVISGFSLRDYFFDDNTRPHIHFHLRIPKELSLKTRLKVKNFSENRKKSEKCMFDEYVYPYYITTIHKSNIDEFIDVAAKVSDDYVREDIGVILKIIKSKL